MKPTRDRQFMVNAAGKLCSALWAGAAMIALLSATAPSAQAILVQNIVGGVTNTVFADNFEGDIIGNSPFFAQVGTWVQPGGGFDPVITNAFPGPAPGAGGTKYLQLTRTGGGSSPNDGAQFTSSINSGVLSSSFYVYIPSGSPDFTLEVGLSTVGTQAGYPPGQVYLVNKGGFVAWLDNPTTYSNTTVAVQAGQWQKWQIDYTFQGNNADNNDFFTITVDGVTSQQINAGMNQFGIQADGPLSFLAFSGGANGATYYVDGVAIPEPSVMGLALAGAASLWLRRRYANAR